MSTPTARLEIVAGKASGMSILVEDELVIGRHAEGAGKLAEDDEISRSHARVALDASGFCAIEDLGSTNGTFVNGLRISAPQTLSEGDVIELGATTMAVRELPELAKTEVPPAATQPTVVPDVDARQQPDAAAASLTAPAPAAPGPDSTPEPTVGEQAAAVAVRAEVDLAAREARVVLEGGPEALHFEFAAGAWRAATRPS